jgi:hypothetical protein
MASTEIQDGIVVTSTPISLGDGSSATLINVPIVTTSRVGTAQDPRFASIKIDNGIDLLYVGQGLDAISTGLHTPAQAKATLNALLDATSTVHGKDEKAYINTYTQKYLNTLAVDSQVYVTSYKPKYDGTVYERQANIGVATIKDLALVDLSATPATVDTAIGATFALVVGAGHVQLRGFQHLVIGDDASQTFYDNSRGGTVYGGGGNDTLILDSFMNRLDQYFHGGKGDDTLDVQGLFSESQIQQHAGYVTFTVTTFNTMTLVNVEHIKTTNGVIDIKATTEQTAIDTLYDHILGRQPDLAGFGYWDAQVKAGQSLGQVAVTMTRSLESGNTLFNGNTSHDLDTLYNVILNRPTDAVGKAFWSAQIDQGHQTLEQVAQGFVTSNELVAQYKPQSEWDFLV